MKKNLLLIQLYGYAQPPNAEPLAIEVLGTAITEDHKSVNVILDTVNIRSLDRDIKRILNIIFRNAPIIVGLSVPQFTLEIAYKLLDEIKAKDNNLLCVLGHALPTFSPNLFLEKYPTVIIVRGWGEESLSYLISNMINGYPVLNKIPNLSFMLKDKIIFTPISWPKKIHIPIRIDVKSYFPRIETSRGCNYSGCSFCTRLPLEELKGRKKWYRRNIDDTLKDVNQIKLLGASNFTITDEDFIGSDIDGAIRLAAGISEIGGLKFTLAVRADDIYNQRRSENENQKRYQLFLQLKNAGLYLLFIGLESLSNGQLKRYGKGISAQESIENLKIVDQMEIDYELGFILFDPFLTRDELFENLRMLEETKLWSRVGQLINLLRPQVSSAYIKKKDFQLLSHECNPDTMTYRTEFFDPEIADIALFTRKWYDEFDQIYLLARSIKRLGVKDENLEHFVLNCRKLMFRFVTESIKRKLLDREYLIRDKIVDEERIDLVNIFMKHLICKAKLSKTEKLIIKECRKFLNPDVNTKG